MTTTAKERLNTIGNIAATVSAALLVIILGWFIAINDKVTTHDEKLKTVEKKIDVIETKVNDNCIKISNIEIIHPELKK
ncbi:MAG: hypothetical protein M1419_01210 [Bacteroidetes bacterium]|nr:hypothetical protein [Bacteroidota bacterium]